MAEKFSSATWMSDNLSIIGDKKLQQICIPGSHDAGMSEYTKISEVASPCNVLTQDVNIEKQLSYGTRYFDIRPVRRGSEYRTGHYGEVQIPKIKLKIGNFGADGEILDDVISGLNRFTHSRAELIVLNVNHFNAAGDSIKTDNEYKDFYQKLGEINHLFQQTDIEKTVDHNKLDFREMTFQELTDGYSCVVIISSGEIPKRSEYNYIFPYSCFPIFDEYANTNSVQGLLTNQNKKMRDHKNEYFLYGGNLTQNELQAICCNPDKIYEIAAMSPLGSTLALVFLITIGKQPSILDLAKKINNQLIDGMVPFIRKDTYPNIINTDGIKDSGIARVCVELNKAIHSPPQKPNTLHVRKNLHANDFLISENNMFMARMQGDGNFLIRNRITGRAIKATDTDGSGGNRIVLQGGGNLVIYKDGGHSVWASDTGDGGERLVLQNSGNLVIYAPDGVATWSSEGDL